MKKLNNKGFAFSTLLYGLLLVVFLTVNLMMTFIQTNRRNTSTLVKQIEEEINRFGRTQTEIVSNYDGGNTFIVPYGKAGWYRVELWAANSSTKATPAEKNSDQAKFGTYIRGDVYLDENDHLYFYIGANSPGKDPTTDVRLRSAANRKDTESAASIIMKAGSGSEGLYIAPAGKDYVANNYKDDGSTLEPAAVATSYAYGYGGAEKTGHVPTTEGADPKIPLRSFVNVEIVPRANAGDAGKARIEMLASDIEKRGRSYANATTISVNGNLSSGTLYAMYHGENLIPEGQRELSSSSATITLNKYKVKEGDIILDINGKPMEVAEGTEIVPPKLDEIAIVPKANGASVAFSSATIGSSSIITASIGTVGSNGSNGQHVSTRAILSTPTETATYYIQNMQNKQSVLSLAGSAVPIKILSGSTSQTWTLEKNLATGNFAIINTSNQLALIKTSSGGTLNVNCRYKECASSLRDWTITGNGDGTVKICNVGAGCLKAPDGEPMMQRTTTVQSYSNQALFKWKLIET